MNILLCKLKKQISNALTKANNLVSIDKFILYNNNNKVLFPEAIFFLSYLKYSKRKCNVLN
jgi:hypothetical protein